MKICVKCNIEKDVEEFRKCKPYKTTDQGTYWRSECRKCEKIAAKQLSIAKKNAPPKPDVCDCCRKPTTVFILDHDHETGLFRGWLCRNCNHGIGKLGDDINGITNAMRYLKAL